MKIALIDVFYKKGSTGKIVYDLYYEYRKQGHDVRVFYGRGKQSENDEAIKISSKLEVYCHVLQTRLKGYVGIGSYFATKKLLRELSDFKPDIVHIHDIHSYYLDSYKLLNYLKNNNISTVYTLHDQWIYTGKCGHPYNCDRWKTGCGNCPQLHEYPKSWIFDRSNKEWALKSSILKDFHNITYVPVSEWIGRKAKLSPFLRDKNFLVINNGIDVEIFSPKKTDKIIMKYKNQIANRKIALHVTPDYYDENKGTKYILELAKKLKNVTFIIVGVPDEVLDTLNGNIICVPRTQNQEELAEFYSLANLTILTSKLESFSMVTAESLCCGTPVIGFGSKGAQEVAPCPYGKFVPYGDVDVLSKLISDVLGEKEKIATKKQCEEFGMQHYGKEKMAKKYLEVYEKLLRYKLYKNM